MRLPRFEATPDQATLRAALDEAGAAIVERPSGLAAIEEVSADLEPWFRRTPDGQGVFFGRRTRRFGAVIAKAPSTAALAIAPGIVDTLEDMLCGPGGGHGERSDCLQLSLSQAISISPGETAQLLHRDDSLFPIRPGFELMANVMWAVDAFTPRNGATQIVPGSHRWERDRVARPDEILSAVMPAGAALVWLGGVLHGGGANRSRRARRGLVFSYSLAWLAQAEKLMVTVPPDVVRTLPERLQRLIGYQIHRPNLGWIEGNDPLDWLMGRVADVAATRDNLKPEQEARLAALRADAETGARL